MASRAAEDAGEQSVVVDDVVEETAEERVKTAMDEFAEAGFPSEEVDATDPISRTKAMNGAVDDLYSLMDSEVEVLGKAFDLLEQLGIKGLEKPPSPKDMVEEMEETPSEN